MTRLSGRASGPVPSTSGTTTSFFGSGIEWDPNLSRRTFPSRSTTVGRPVRGLTLSPSGASSTVVGGTATTSATITSGSPGLIPY